MTDQNGTTEQQPVEQNWYFDSTTGQFFSIDGELYPFRFDPKKAEFTTAKGYKIELRNVDNHVLADYGIAYQQKYEPDMPKRPIEYEPGKFYLTSDAHDEGYKRAYNKYQQTANLAIFAFQVSLAVKNHFPEQDEWTDSFRLWVNAIAAMEDKQPLELSIHRLRYQWVYSLLSTEIESLIFTQILQGKQMPTAEGIRDAEVRFPGERE